jgi:hypothetical protein
VPMDLLTKDEQRAPVTLPPATVLTEEEDELRLAARRQVKRVRRLKINVAAWLLGTAVFTTLWVVSQWQANGGFERFGTDGNPGDWNPTLWALAVGVWGLIVGIMALRAYFERPATIAEVDREVARLKAGIATTDAPSDLELRRFTHARLERVRRLKFHIAAWALGMAVLTPLWALIEWQDNGGFERWSDNGNPGDWEPTIVYVGAIWALVIAIFALQVYLDRPTKEAEIDREVRRLRSHG